MTTSTITRRSWTDREGYVWIENPDSTITLQGGYVGRFRPTVERESGPLIENVVAVPLMADTTTCAHGVPLGPGSSCAECDQVCKDLDAAVTR